MPTTSQLKLKEKEVGTQSDNTKKLPTSENSISQRISDYNKSCTSAQITPSVSSSHDTIEKAKKNLNKPIKNYND
jgi:phage shock protein A